MSDEVKVKEEKEPPILPVPRVPNAPPLAEVVLQESELRFALFPTNKREVSGSGILRCLLSIHPKELEVRFPEAKIHLVSVFRSFTQQMYPAWHQLRLVWSAEPLKKYVENTLDITKPEHLHPATWPVITQWHTRAPKPPVMVCSDTQGQQKAVIGDTVSTHLLLHPVNPKVLSMPKAAGVFYLLNAPPVMGDAKSMLCPVNAPVSVRIRITRTMLARAAWLQLARHSTPKITRILRIDTCTDLNVYGFGNNDDPLLKWNICRLGSCDENALWTLGVHLAAWLTRHVDGHVFARKMQVMAEESLKLDHVPWLFALLQFTVWLLVTNNMMRQYTVEIHGASPECVAALMKLTPKTCTPLSEKIPESVRKVYLELLKRDPTLLTPMKLVCV